MMLIPRDRGYDHGNAQPSKRGWCTRNSTKRLLLGERVAKKDGSQKDVSRSSIYWVCLAPFPFIDCVLVWS
jgi:hypothetical protein